MTQPSGRETRPPIDGPFPAIDPLQFNFVVVTKAAWQKCGDSSANCIHNFSYSRCFRSEDMFKPWRWWCIPCQECLCLRQSRGHLLDETHIQNLHCWKQQCRPDALPLGLTRKDVIIDEVSLAAQPQEHARMRKRFVIVQKQHGLEQLSKQQLLQLALSEIPLDVEESCSGSSSCQSPNGPRPSRAEALKIARMKSMDSAD